MAVANQGAQQSSWQTVLILWGALLASTFVYIGLLLSGQIPEPTEPPPPMLPYALAPTALGVLVVSVILPRRFFDAALSAWKPATNQVPDPNASVMFRDQTPTIDVFANPAEAERAMITRFFTPFILGMALSEAIAIFGFLLGIMHFDPMLWAPFFVVAWVSMLARFPSKARLRARVEERMGIRFEQS